MRELNQKNENKQVGSKKKFLKKGKKERRLFKIVVISYLLVNVGIIASW